jgi:hypothetical protein
MALMVSLFFSLGLTLYSSWIAVRIMRHWDLASGSEEQLALERKTYLISTVFVLVMWIELFGLFLFVFTVDRIHILFVGAMCAAGTLNVNDYGYPLLLVKMTIFILCGLWLIMNHLDNTAFDYPLIRNKCVFLIVITALIPLEAFLQWRYFTLMEPSVITSCCGTLFSSNAANVAGSFSAWPPRAAKVVFYLTVILTLRVGIHFILTGIAARLYSFLSGLLFFVSLASILAFISVHFYELPSHHCPFCLLHREYHYVGYPLYVLLFGAGVTGMGVGVIDRFRNQPSLQNSLPKLQKRLSLVSMVCFFLFSLLATSPMFFSDFTLDGY